MHWAEFEEKGHFQDRANQSEVCSAVISADFHHFRLMLSVLIQILKPSLYHSNHGVG